MKHKIILFKAIVGSNAHGTNTENSDVDIKGVYMQDPFEAASFDYQQQEILDKDTTYWEIQRFLELCCSSNPSVLELLYSPEDCILEKHPLFDIVLKNRYIFLSKECKNSFLGYARQQIHKAKGLDKKMNWESERITRKKPIDFCKFLWLGHNGYDNPTVFPTEYTWWNKCGWSIDYRLKGESWFHVLTKIDNMKQLYMLWHVENIPEDVEWNKGLCNDDDLLVSPIPEKYMNRPAAIVQYDLDGFQHHCREYNQYQTWLKERNEQRWVDVNNHGQKIDGKNMMHCMRLIETAKDIVEKGDLIVRRGNASELLKIRHGELNLQELIDKADAYFEEIETAFKTSSLPDSINKNEVNKLLLNIRKESLKYFYE